jgi:SAM-dependent methyltransferase
VPGAIQPLSHTATNARVLALLEAEGTLGGDTRILDLGAGEGYFSNLVGQRIERLGRRPAGVTCTRIDAGGRLPYADGTFDAVCSIEVVEHVQDQFAFCRELLRVLKPGGLAVVSTPNVLNLNSRWRILHSGFATLFNPLSLSSVDVVHTSGHIHPISYYYLAYALRHAGARTVRVEFDRFKTSARLLLILLWPVLVIGSGAFRARVARRWPEIYRENRHHLREVHGVKMLTARSIIVVARKGP